MFLSGRLASSKEACLFPVDQASFTGSWWANEELEKGLLSKWDGKLDARSLPVADGELDKRLSPTAEGKLF